jgi:hypothetical protein
MDLFNLLRGKGTLACAAAGLALVAGCGGETTDISEGVNQTNQDLAQAGAKLDCPKEVDGGEGTEFDCKMQSTDGSKSTDVKLKVIKEGEELGLAPVDEAAFQKAVEEVAAG